MLSPQERLTAQFYDWEQRSRGWYAFDMAVEIEPIFQPFYYHNVEHEGVRDDTQKHTILSRLTNLFNSKEIVEQDNSDPFVFAVPFENNSKLIAIGIALPKEHTIGVDEIEELLLMLSLSSLPMSFEIVATSSKITFQIVCREEEVELVYMQLRAHLQGAILSEQKTDIDILQDGLFSTGIDLGLCNEFMCSLRMTKDIDSDPLVGLYALLENIKDGERAIIQLLFKGTHNPWAESIMRSVSDGKGGSFFEDAPDMIKNARDKVAFPLYSVCIRAIAQSNEKERSEKLAKLLSQTLIQTSKSNSNCLIPLTNPNYPAEDYFDDILLRQSNRLGMLLNSRELITFLHFPNPNIVSHKIDRQGKRTKIAPDITQGHKFILGINQHQGNERIVSVSDEQRLRHTHIIGATGTGKSTFLLNLIREDIEQGNGIAVLDPHGDLVESILARIPEHRVEDVVLIDPADADFPVGFNILSAHSDIEKEILSSDLVAVFRRLSTSWGDQMNSVFANAILAFLESTESGTLSDLRRFLIEPSFRNKFLLTVTDSNVVYYWQHSFPLLKTMSLGSIITRLDAFLRPKPIRNMVIQKKGIDFEMVMDTKKILLVKLSQGLIGAENSYLLGTLIVSKIYQSALSRQIKAKSERSNFFLYIDEFQNFITPSMSGILSGARKYHLGLILAHQDMMQLQKFDTELASSVIANPGTRICFRVGDIDAKKFQDGFSFFIARDLQDLKLGEAIMRIDRPDYDFNLQITPLPDVPADIAEVNRNIVIDKSHEKYSTPKEVVEQTMQLSPPMTTVSKEKLVAKEKTGQNEKVIPTITKETRITEPIVNVKKDSQHRKLQMLIKLMAEARGYKATIEELIANSNERVDVSLERAGKRIACEISVTTDDTWEFHNIEKCLNAGYGVVIICSNNPKHIEKIKSKAKDNLPIVMFEKVLFFDPQNVIDYLSEQLINDANYEKVVKGYRIKVEYDATSVDEMKKKHDSVVRAVTGSIKRKN